MTLERAAEDAVVKFALASGFMDQASLELAEAQRAAGQAVVGDPGGHRVHKGAE